MINQQIGFLRNVERAVKKDLSKSDGNRTPEQCVGTYFPKKVNCSIGHSDKAQNKCRPPYPPESSHECK